MLGILLEDKLIKIDFLDRIAHDHVVIMWEKMKRALSTHSPSNFPSSIENKYHVKRSDYDILITALRLTVANQASFGYQQYIDSVQKQGFDVRLAIIKTGWDGTPADSGETSTAQTFANGEHFPLFMADASKDPNEEASRIRQQLYPQHVLYCFRRHENYMKLF